MIKKAILFSLVIAPICSAYGSANDLTNISKVANEYISSISGGFHSKPVKILTLKNGNEYAVIYSDIPTGSSIGATGNMGMQFVDVVNGGIAYYVDTEASTPNITFSGWPIVKYVRNAKNKMVVDVRTYGPRDSQSCMSYVYRETLVRNSHKNWIVSNKKFLDKGGCGTLG